VGARFVVGAALEREPAWRADHVFEDDVAHLVARSRRGSRRYGCPIAIGEAELDVHSPDQALSRGRHTRNDLELSLTILADERDSAAE